MKKGRKITALLLALAAAGAMTAGLVACKGDDPDSEKQEQTTVAEKLKEGGAIVLTDGSASIDLTQYVKANGNTFRATSSNPKVAAVALSGSTLTVTAAGEGSSVIMVVCGEVHITFTVSVPEAYYSVTLDGEPVPPSEGDMWKAGASYTLPEAKTPADPNFEFKGWNVNGETKQAGETVTVNKNLTITALFERKAAHEVNGHAQSVTLSVGKSVAVETADYIAAYGREVRAVADGNEFITVDVQNGIVTLTGVATGDATLTLSTEGVAVSIEIHVLSADMPTFENTTISIDLFTANSGSVSFTPTEPEGHTYSYEYSLSTQDDRATVSEGTLTYDLGADYEAEEGGETVSLIVSVAVEMDGVAAGTVTFTVTVKIKDTAPAAPVFNNATATIDPFSEEESENSYTLELKAEDENFTYVYEIGGVVVSGNKKYTAVADETVEVTYTYKGNTLRSGTASFTVKIDYDKTHFPSLIEERKTENIDLASVKNGVYVLDLFANFTESGNIAGYTVNGTDHVSGSEYSISNAGGEYGETAKAVTFTVVATVKNGLGDPLTYTYTVNVTDTTAFRMQNGGFEDGLNGWTGATGSPSSDATYWGQYSSNNDGQYYVGIDGGTETLVSPSFVVGGSGWITFKFGSARPIEGNTPRNVHLEFYEKKSEGGGTDIKIADVRNILWKDPEAALKLNDYKLDLSAFKRKTVYVKAVDGENGGDFRSIYLDAFVTYWKDAPTDAKYTDLSATRYFDTIAEINLKEANTFTLGIPALSQGLVGNATFTAEVDKAGLNIDDTNPLLLTATKSGDYTVTYKVDGETAFTVKVNVLNTVETPMFENAELNVKKGESGALALPVPEEDSRFTYEYSVGESGVEIAEGSLRFDASAREEGTYSFRVSVIVTDTKWGEGGDAFEKSFTVTVTVYGDKIIAGDLLTDGRAETAWDVYAIKEKSPEAISSPIDFSGYLIVPDGVTVNYSVTRKIGDGEAAAVETINGIYELPFADCGITVNTVKTVLFEVTAVNGEDSSNTVSFKLTVSIKDTTENRVVNGGFETGDMTGWTTATDGFNLGTCVISANEYWSEQLPYNQGGNYHLDGWNTGIAEEGTWTVRSSSFTLGGSGWITVRMGGHAAAVKVYKENGELVGYYQQSRFADVHFNDGFLAQGGSWADMATYAIDLSEFIGEKLYVELCDEAITGWANAFFDELITYYEVAPDWQNMKETVVNAHKASEPRDESDVVDIPWVLAVNKSDLK